MPARSPPEHGHCATAIRASIWASPDRQSKFKQLVPMLTNLWPASLRSAPSSRSRQGNRCPNGDRNWIRSRWSEQSHPSRSAVALGQVGIVDIADRTLRHSNMVSFLRGQRACAARDSTQASWPLVNPQQNSATICSSCPTIQKLPRDWGSLGIVSRGWPDPVGWSRGRRRSRQAKCSCGL